MVESAVTRSKNIFLKWLRRSYEAARKTLQWGCCWGSDLVLKEREKLCDINILHWSAMLIKLELFQKSTMYFENVEKFTAHAKIKGERTHPWGSPPHRSIHVTHLRSPECLITFRRNSGGMKEEPKFRVSSVLKCIKFLLAGYLCPIWAACALDIKVWAARDKMKPDSYPYNWSNNIKSSWICKQLFVWKKTWSTLI